MSVEIDFEYRGMKGHASLLHADDAKRAVSLAREFASGLFGDSPKKSVECEFCRDALFVGFRGMDAPCPRCNSLKAFEWFNGRLEKAFAATASLREEFEGQPTKNAWEDAKRTIDELTHDRDKARKQLTEAREALERVPD